MREKEDPLLKTKLPTGLCAASSSFCSSSKLYGVDSLPLRDIFTCHFGRQDGRSSRAAVLVTEHRIERIHTKPVTRRRDAMGVQSVVVTEHGDV
ncbi:unnamed protein product [Protopolystoma xenopodis]|uniref:Uncharacterized protein n=1 Tax=Protopolystoma xenopodis TaxID=117903 RepID=A0A3S5A1I8_9PLAT|nr:unnamed protein product [Protopolystoma xenopodis]